MVTFPCTPHTTALLRLCIGLPLFLSACKPQQVTGPEKVRQCVNGVQDNNEMGVDCGGICNSPCVATPACRVPEDCISGECKDGACTDPCTDGRRNGDETDVDCGGSCAAGCAPGQSCTLPGDCTAQICLPEKVCGTTCGNGLKEPSEACEGSALGDQTCLDLGFAGGQLACTENCSFDTSGCGTCSAHVALSSGDLGDSWSRSGPPGGHITALLALGKNVVLAGTGTSLGRAGARPVGYGSAIYRSTDGGVTFVAQQRFIEMNGTEVHRFTRVPSSGRLYAAVGSYLANSNGLWLSDDDGLNWTKTSAGLHTGARPRWVSATGGVDERVYAMIQGIQGTPGGAHTSLYRRDKGGDWSLMTMTGVDQNDGGPARGLAAHPTAVDTVFVSTFKTFYTSIDGGDSFTGLDFDAALFTAASNTDELYIDPLDGDHIVLTTRFEEMIESIDGGKEWTRTSLPFGGQNGVAFSKGDTYATTRGYGLQVSTGQDYSPRGECLQDPNPTAVSIAPDDPNQIFVGFDGQGVLHSEDKGLTYTPQVSGIDDLLSKVVVTGPETAPVAWIVSPAGLFFSTDRGGTWTRLADGFGTLAFTSVAQDPETANRILAGTNGDWYRGGGPSQGIFDINLSTGVITKPSGLVGDSPEINGLAFDPTDASIVYAYQDTGVDGDDALVPTQLLLSTDGGLSFAPTGLLSKSFVGYSVCSGSQFSVSPAGHPYVCVRPATGNTTELYRSTNKGKNFDMIWSGLPTSLGNIRRYFPYSGVFVDDEQRIFFTSAGTSGLASSSNGGGEFGDYGNGLTSFATQSYHMTFSPTGAILLATGDGAYYAANAIDFVELNQGLESFSRGPRAISVAIIPGTPTVALMATAQGLYRRTLPKE